MALMRIMERRGYRSPQAIQFSDLRDAGLPAKECDKIMAVLRGHDVAAKDSGRGRGMEMTTYGESSSPFDRRDEDFGGGGGGCRGGGSSGGGG